MVDRQAGSEPVGSVNKDWIKNMLRHSIVSDEAVCQPRVDDDVIPQRYPHMQALRSLGWTEAVFLANILKGCIVFQIALNVHFPYNKIGIVSIATKPCK